MVRFLRSTAIALVLGFFLPAPAAIFVYKSAHAADPAIPDWIAASCCGPKDAHRLRVDQVMHNADDGYYTVEGVGGFSPSTRIPDRILQPSQDGYYWLFFGAATQSVYCFFAPMSF
jgi:hypothetical protein